MSKKKALSTMSLKDFHGGSIPSDLPLPSAPGLVGSSGSDRSVPSNWGNNLANSDLRPRLKSPGAAHNFGEKTSFLSHPAPIGRNFDEDERKPLNSVLTPRRTVGDESAPTSPSVHQELKSDYVSSVRVSDRQVSSPSSVTSSSPVKVGGADQFVVHSPIPASSSGQNNSNIPSGNNNLSLSNSQPNAWGVRKEVIASEETVKSSTLSGPDAISKIAQASALEKVSSGMWQSKKPSQLLPHLLHSRDNDGNVFDGVDAISDRANYDCSWGSQVENIQLAEEKNKSGFRESPKNYVEDGCTGANTGGSLHSPALPQEISERRKLKLSPRSGLLERSENNYRQHQEPAFTEVESVNKLYRNVDSPKPGATITVGEGQSIEKPVERPKLNLKPRSQPLDQSDGRLEKERQTLFGGARPRELVLKERGIDETAISNLELGHALNRVDTPKNEPTSERLIPSTQRKQNTDNHAHEMRIERNLERQEQQMGRGRNDNQGRSKRMENRWGSRDTEKQQQDERHEPDTWRKPIEEPKVAPADASGVYPGKVVSALDLARAFSKSVSDPKMHEQHSNERGLPELNNQMPFSRLTDTRQLNSAPTIRHK